MLSITKSVHFYVQGSGLLSLTVLKAQQDAWTGYINPVGVKTLPLMDAKSCKVEPLSVFQRGTLNVEPLNLGTIKCRS